MLRKLYTGRCDSVTLGFVVGTKKLTFPLLLRLKSRVLEGAPEMAYLRKAEMSGSLKQLRHTLSLSSAVPLLNFGGIFDW